MRTKRNAGETETHFKHTPEIAAVAELLPDQSPIRFMLLEPLSKLFRLTDPPATSRRRKLFGFGFEAADY